MNKTIPFTEQDIIGYLDRCIIFWVNIKKRSDDAGVQEMADNYIDAFQSVRMTIFGYMKEVE